MASEASFAMFLTIIATVVMFLKMVWTNVGLGGARMNAGARAPEDTYQKQPTGEEKEKMEVALERNRRIVGNDLENIPIGLFLFWGTLLAIGGSTSGSYALHDICLLLFVAGRIGHSVCYKLGLSKPRSLCFALGLVACLGEVVNAVITAFGLL